MCGKLGLVVCSTLLCSLYASGSDEDTPWYDEYAKSFLDMKGEAEAAVSEFRIFVDSVTDDGMIIGTDDNISKLNEHMATAAAKRDELSKFTSNNRRLKDVDIFVENLKASSAKVVREAAKLLNHYDDEWISRTIEEAKKLIIEKLQELIVYNLQIERIGGVRIFHSFSNGETSVVDMTNMIKEINVLLERRKWPYSVSQEAGIVMEWKRLREESFKWNDKELKSLKNHLMDLKKRYSEHLPN